MRTLPARLLMVLLVLCFGVGCSTDGGSSPTGSGTSAGTSTPTKSTQSRSNSDPTRSAAAYRPQEFHGAPQEFYQPPNPMPKVPHGTLLRYERSPLKMPGGTMWKVMYASTSLTGKRIAVTGMVIVPTGKAPAAGWKLISVAHGTTGVADDCAPSKADLPKQAGAPFPVSLVRHNYQRFAKVGYLKAGYVLSLTDYEGLGTPGVHPYLVGRSEARSVLDATRAARQLPAATKVQKRFAIWGYSQGGHAAAWADDLARNWTPELRLVGTVAGGPVSEMNLVANTLASTQMSPDLFFMIIAGYTAAYPELHPSQVLTPAGIRVLKRFGSSCNAFETAAKGRKMSAFVKPGFDSNTAWQRRLGQNNPGQNGEQAPAAPLLILHSNSDEIVPVFLSKTMSDRMCTIGWTVERRVYHNGKGHVAEASNAMTDGLTWINARMAGKKPVSTCPRSTKSSKSSPSAPGQGTAS